MRIGITLIAAFFLFMFALSLFTSVSILLFKDEFIKELKRFDIPPDIDLNSVVTLTFLIGCVYSAFCLAAGVGLLMLKEWGRKLALLLSLLHIAYGILTVALIPPSAINLIIGFPIFIYLNRKSVKDEFVEYLSIEEKILGEKF